MKDEKLRRAYAALLTRRSGGDRSRCLTTDQLRNLIDREGHEAERLELLDHVMSCGSCHHEFKLLRAAMSPPTLMQRLLRFRLEVAFGLLLLVAAGALWVQTGKRLSGPMGLGRDPRPVVLVSPVGATPLRDTIVLLWRRVENAIDYEIELRDEAGVAIFTTRTSETALPLPDSILLLRGHSYSWSVRAILPRGSRYGSTSILIEPDTGQLPFGSSPLARGEAEEADVGPSPK